MAASTAASPSRSQEARLGEVRLAGGEVRHRAGPLGQGGLAALVNPSASAAYGSLQPIGT